MHVLSGRIAVVQEQRFRLRTRDGRVLLLTLAHDAPLAMRDLERLERAGVPVVVTYEGAPNLTSGVAHDVRPLVAEAGAA